MGEKAYVMLENYRRNRLVLRMFYRAKGMNYFTGTSHNGSFVLGAWPESVKPGLSEGITMIESTLGDGINIGICPALRDNAKRIAKMQEIVLAEKETIGNLFKKHIVDPQYNSGSEAYDQAMQLFAKETRDHLINNTKIMDYAPVIKEVEKV